MPTFLSDGRSPVPRRSLLWLAAGGPIAVGTLAACTASPQPPAPTATPGKPDPQTSDLTAEQALVNRYDHTIRAHPTLAARLRPIRDQHQAHAAALRDLIGPAATRTSGPATRPSGSATGAAPSGSSSPSPGSAAGTTPASGSPAASSGSGTTGVPADPDAALAALRTAEQQAAAARTRSCLAASTPHRSGLLGSIAASESSHVTVLS